MGVIEAYRSIITHHCPIYCNLQTWAWKKKQHGIIPRLGACQLSTHWPTRSCGEPHLSGSTSWGLGKLIAWDKKNSSHICHPPAGSNGNLFLRCKSSLNLNDWMMKADVMALFSCVKQTKSPCSQKPTEKITTSNPSSSQFATSGPRNNFGIGPKKYHLHYPVPQGITQSSSCTSYNS